MQLDGLSALSGDELAADPVRAAGYQMSAMKAAFEHGRPLIADPRDVPERRRAQPLARCGMRAAVLAKAPATSSQPRRHLTALMLQPMRQATRSASCRACSTGLRQRATSSVTGILFNNRMRELHLPNSPTASDRAKRRPCSSAGAGASQRPACALRHGELTRPASARRTTTQLVDRGRDVAAAGGRPPRTVQRACGASSKSKANSTSAITSARLGHAVTRAPDPYSYGSAKVIERFESGMFAGAGDHRREAFALGFFGYFIKHHGLPPRKLAAFRSRMLLAVHIRLKALTNRRDPRGRSMSCLRRMPCEPRC